MVIQVTKGFQWNGGFISLAHEDNNKNLSLLKGEVMKRANILLFITLFAVGSLFPLPISWAAVDLSEDQIRCKIVTLINPKGIVHIQGIQIDTDDRGQLNLEIDANLGSCWGKKEYAKGFARDALKALFASDLPISHVILNVFGGSQPLLSVALGKNQARNMNWDEGDSLNAFYERLKSRTNYKGDPEDFCWLIEKSQGLNP